MMGAESVAYHRETIIERSDDHAGQALEYYASRGETPLLWGGRGGAALGLTVAADLTGITHPGIVSMRCARRRCHPTRQCGSRRDRLRGI